MSDSEGKKFTSDVNRAFSATLQHPVNEDKDRDPKRVNTYLKVSEERPLSTTRQ